MSLDPIKGNLKISLDKSLSNRFNFKARQNVVIRLVQPENISLDDIEVSFKNQYVGRCDMWRIHKALLGQCVYETQQILIQNQRLTVDKLSVCDGADKHKRRGEKSSRPVKSGLYTSNTNSSFRSRSANVCLLVNLSSEMW